MSLSRAICAVPFFRFLHEGFQLDIGLLQRLL